jgi:hypothetical protein
MKILTQREEAHRVAPSVKLSNKTPPDSPKTILVLWRDTKQLCLTNQAWSLGLVSAKNGMENRAAWSKRALSFSESGTRRNMT